MSHINQNRIMESSDIDTPQDCKVLLSEFEKCYQYVLKHHAEIYWMPLDYYAYTTGLRTYDEIINGKTETRPAGRADADGGIVFEDGGSIGSEHIGSLTDDGRVRLPDGTVAELADTLEMDEETGEVFRTTVTPAEPCYTRCGSGNMPTLDLDGSVYSCFRFLPDSPYDHKKWRSGFVDKDGGGDILENKENLDKLRAAMFITNLKTHEDCKTCPIYSACPYCVAGCMIEAKLEPPAVRTTSVCNFARVSAYYAMKYWEEVNRLYPEKYSREYPVTWDPALKDEILAPVLSFANGGPGAAVYKDLYQGAKHEST
jgi:radical SAM protein with 4Fe4S-binding SPASM domain